MNATLRFSLFALSLTAAACGSCGPEPVPADAGDDVRSDAGEQDVGPDAALQADAAGDMSISPQTASVSGGGVTVDVAFNPFSLTLIGENGEVGRTLAGDEPGFGGLQFGRVNNYIANRYNNPKRLDPEDFTWFRPAALLAADLDENDFSFLVATVSADGEEGPSVAFTITPTEDSVRLDIALDTEEPEFVTTTFSMAAASETEGFYGLGEHFDTLDVRGSKRVMMAVPEGSSESGLNEVHVPVSFLFSTEGYGLFVDSRYPGGFDIAATRDDALQAVYNTTSLTMHFMAASDPMQLIEDYTDLTGKPAHVPYWALAPQWWRNANKDQAEVIDDIQRGRDADIPSTVMWIDRPWSSYYHNYRFNPSQFPNPQAMADEIRRQGHRLILHHSPQLSPPGRTDFGDDEDASDGLWELYEEMGWLVIFNGNPFIFPWGGGSGGFIDWTAEGAVDNVHSLIPRVTDLGAVGTKMDWDEYIVPNIGVTRLELEFSNGETSETMHGWYSALYHKAMIEGFDAAAGEPTFHISRSGYPRDQQWNTCIWPGDLDNDFSPHTRGPSDFQEEWNVGGMPAAIYANQSLGFVGYPCFGSDIGGYRGGLPTEEVLLRWLAFGTFNGVMQLGGAGSSHMPWTADTIYSTEALDITRTYFKLRMRLFPYIHDLFLQSEQTGRPVVRSMYLQYGDVGRPYEEQFMFGPDVLVAPVYQEGATERDVWLPEGDWVDLWTGEVQTGPATVTRTTPIDIIPVFLRAGSVIPLAAEGIDTLVDAPAPDVDSYLDNTRTDVWVVPGDVASSFDLFNGLGVTMEAVGSELSIEWTVGSPSSDVDPRIAFNPETLGFVIEATDWLAAAPSRVEVDRAGTLTTLPEGTDCTECWSFDPTRGQLRVIVDAAAGSLSVAP